MGWFDKLRQKPKADHNDDEQTRLILGVGRMPYPAYRGKEPYVFVSYAHLDSEKVYDKIYHWPDTVKTQRGYNINFGEISSVVFGEGSFYKDRLSDIWSYGTNPGWIKEWPVTLSFRDGRTLSTRIAEDYLKFFAIDDFGKVEARADQIRRISFIDGTNEQNEVTKN